MLRDNPQLHFELFRYQLLPISQHVQKDMFREILSTKELKEKKNAFFQKILDEFPPLQYRDATINFRVDLAVSPWYVIEINTQKTLQRDKPDFEKERIDTWPHIIIAINNQPDIQLIAISRNKKAFSSCAVVAKMLQDNFQRLLHEYYLNIQIDALFDKNHFWELIKKHSGKITSVKFELISPNMANISKDLELDLAQLNVDTNSHRTDLKLNSGEGSVLEINPENTLLNSLVDYSSEGGGDIELRLKGVTKAIRTSKTARELSIDEFSAKNLSPDMLTMIFEKLL